VGVFLAAVVAVGDEEVAAGQAEVFADHDCYYRGHEETVSGEEGGEDGGGGEDLPGDCMVLLANNPAWVKDDERLTNSETQAGDEELSAGNGDVAREQHARV
jgi:hypothetical protein